MGKSGQCGVGKTKVHLTITPFSAQKLLYSYWSAHIPNWWLGRGGRDEKGGSIGCKTWVYPRFQNLSFNDITKPPTTPFSCVQKCHFMYMYSIWVKRTKNVSSVHTFDLADCSRYDLVFAISKMTYSQLDRNSSTVICFRDDWL